MLLDAFLLPLKGFEQAKERLRTRAALDVPALVAALATEVIRSCAPVPVIVVTESDEIVDFARQLATEVWHADAQGLNDALQGAYMTFGERFRRLAIVPGDLLYPQGLGAFDPAAGVTIVTDQHGTGTSVLSLPGGLDFRFSYGPGSAQRHEAEARRLGLEVHLITDSPWCRDVDHPADLGSPLPDEA